MALFYLCAWCREPRRHLYLLTRVGAKLVDYLGLRCQVCAGLLFGSQGRYITRVERALFGPFLQGHRTVLPFPRDPWVPRAVSDPRLVAGELFRLEEGSAALGFAGLPGAPRVLDYPGGEKSGA